jgi:hypothetical protein
VRCSACGAVEHLDAGGEMPPGWYRVHLAGRVDRSRDVIGRFCGLDCLVVEALGRYGLTEQQVRQWLAGAG